MAASADVSSSADVSPKANKKSPPDGRAVDSDEENVLSAPPSNYRRDRLDSESSSKASNKKIPKAGSATSKSSSSTRHTRQRQDSLKHAKEIAESTTSPSPRRGAHATRNNYSRTLEAFSTPRGLQGNQFRVANVGMHGKIYLRPVTKPSTIPAAAPLQSPTRTKPILRVPKVEESASEERTGEKKERAKDSNLKENGMQEKKEAGEDEDEDEKDEDDGAGDNMSMSINYGEGTRTDFTGRESMWTKLSTAQDVRGAPSDIFKHQPRPRSRRSMSESTVSQAPVRASALAQTKAFKVVIDRPDSDPASQRHQSSLGHSFNGLDISIPNYRMGSPRFTDQGSPFLFSSMHAPSGSQAPSLTSPFLERIPDPSSTPLGPSPLQNAQRPLPARRHSQASPYAQSISSFSYDSPTVPNSNGQHELSHQPTITGHETISPGIYDSLSAAPNDASVVRYSQQTGEMVAATPARLIVQITAETFLDYELLSDFFLTVRSYLSIHDLLSLLLARFEWAVNRFDDNGRIIRVRSFAAIRHWILNYFAYDFVPDRRLRLQFTRKMNYLFKLVQSRQEYGLPDMKLISDLKKCWNGRCVLYWAGPVDNSLEADILPGGPGVEGEDDLDDLDDAAIGSVTAASTDEPYSTPSSPPAGYNIGAEQQDDRQTGAQQPHSRTTSGTTSQSMPLSPTSEISIAMATKKAAKEERMPAGQPQEGQKTRISNRHSDGSSDLTGGVSQGSEPQQVVSYPLQTSAYRSVLRGHLLAPASPYVTTAPTTPGLHLSSPTLSPQSEDPRKRQMLSGVSSSGGPGVKQFMSSIKRALSSKVSSGAGLPYSEVPMSESSPVYGNPPQRLEGLNPRANIPVEVITPHAGGGPGGSSAMDSVRAAMRIDILAEQISMEFQKAIQGNIRSGGSRPDMGPSAQTPRAMPTTQQGPPPRGMSFLSPAEAKQVPSGMTSSSQSIVIFDDTGDSPSMPLPPQAEKVTSQGEHTPRGSTFTQNQLDVPQNQGPQSIAVPRRMSMGDVDVSTHGTNSADHSAVATPSRLSYVDAQHQRKPSLGSASLRRVASYQSTLNRPSVESAAQQNVAMALAIPDAPAQVDESATPTSTTPTRALRRVPGGDLRANHNVADLEIQLTPRPKSTGSIATFASTRESEMLSFGDRITKTFKRDRSDRPLISPGIAGSFDAPFKKPAEKENVEEKKVSYIRTQSDDKVNRRPSFEAMVASFADIPDEDEGGLEATLMKLEGRYRKGEITAAKAAAAAKNAAAAAKAGEDRASGKLAPPTGKRKPSTSSSNETVHGRALNQRATIASFVSEDSYNSTPLLEREPTASPKGKGKGLSTTRSYLGLRPKSSARRSTTNSFLLDAQEEDSSEDGSEDPRRRSDATTQQSRLSSSAPLTNGQRMVNGAGNVGTKQQVGGSAHRNFVEPHIGRTGGPTSQTHPAVHIPLAQGLQPRHMPFVLGHDSKLICEQFTLIEKDALREIDWRDLVDMRWQHTPLSVTNWVKYLVSGNPLGIDLVTARFNIMVKWTLSEIVLTESTEERALVIIKYIHIAREARRICNYATLLQLTIALTSADCSRLKKTWDLVPPTEKAILRDLEALVSPLRNFAGLRSEMEDAPAEHGCIPVLALYIHDLTYNAQKPPVIEVDLGMGGAGSEASNMHPTRLLINFERYRNTAVIVKNLLRLIDASSRYNYVPVDDVLSHCMWIACLPDEVINAKSREIEGPVITPGASRAITRG